MSVQIENLGGLQRKIAVVFPSSEITQEVSARLKNVAKQVVRPGFRRGKVPLSIIEKEFASQVKMEAAVDRAARFFFDVSKDQQLKVAGKPNIEPRDAVLEDTFGFDILFEVMPTINQINTSEMNLIDYQCPIDEQKINDAMHILQLSKATFTETSEAAQMGDSVVCNFELTFEDGQKENKKQKVFLSEESLAPFKTLITQVIGLKATDTKVLTDEALIKELNLSEVAHKSITVTIEKVENTVLPEINAEFIEKTTGIKDKDIEFLRQEIKNNLDKEINRRTYVLTRDQVIDAVIAKNPLDLPSQLLDEEVARLLENFKQRLMQNGFGANMFGSEFDEGMKKNFIPQAKRNLHIGLILSHVIELQQFKVNPDALKAEVEKLAASYENSKQVVSWYYENKEELQNVELSLLERTVIEFLAKDANKTLENVSFEKLNELEEKTQDKNRLGDDEEDDEDINVKSPELIENNEKA